MIKFNKTAVLLLAAVLTTATLSAQSKKDKKKKKNQTDTTLTSSTDNGTKKDEIKSIEEVTKKCKKIEGLFTFFQDTTNGSLYILVKKDQIGKEYIYFTHTVDGIVQAGHYRGAYRDNEVFSIQQYFNKIEFVKENNNFYFDPKNPISKAADANISKAVLASIAIAGQNKDKTEFLLKADDLFLTEALHQVKPSSNPNAKPGSIYSLGTLSKEKTKYLKISNYPKNSDVVVEYVYDNPSPVVRSGGHAADDRSVSIKLQHSIIEMPQNNFKPRFDDPRVGYFITQKNDMTSTSATPYHDFIHRWHLEKKDKNAELSEPVEPIVWWIENTTPHEFRDIIAEAVLKWNEAFEKAGFKNAIQVKVQPDDADWDAGDIRYNVLRWTSSPQPPFGGYGPSFVNPRTGQILGADVMLEYVYLTNRLRQQSVFETYGLMHLEEQNHTSEHSCNAGHYLHHNAMLGMWYLNQNNASEAEKSEYIKHALYYLVMHEVGHTLGLNHNMKASQLHMPDKINDTTLTRKVGLIASVMDYPAVNLAADKAKQGDYFTIKVGPYDIWAIEYGYSPALEDENAEKERLNKILERSTEHQLMFGNDADDMRAPGKAIDPRVMVNDLSGDAISYSIERMKIVNKMMADLKKKYSKPGQSYQELRNAYLLLTSEANNAVTTISRYIGGVYVDRAFEGQKGAANKPFTPVSYNDQKRAMEALAKFAFAPNAFELPADLIAYLQQQRRGFGFFMGGEDPKIHTRNLLIQKGVLMHVLHPTVMQRLTDSELYGNQYKLSEMLNDLTAAIFKADLTTKVNSFRQNLQTEYVNMLIDIAKETSSYDNRSRNLVVYQLKQIERQLSANKGVDADTQAHREALVIKIKKFFDKA
jgi:hypothetical protein